MVLAVAAILTASALLSTGCLPAQSATVKILPRSAWGAVAPKCRTTVNSAEVQYAAVHYSAILGHTTSSIKAIQTFHMGPQRGWCDIAYNFIVLQDGRVFEGRGWNVAGGHTLGYNRSAVAIVAMLGVGETPSMAMKRSIRAWRDAANAKYGRALKTLGHRDFPGNATDCPGKLTDWVRRGMPL